MLERKPCAKGINDNTVLAISDFWRWKALGASSRLYASWDFGRPRKTSDVFGRLRHSSGIFGNNRVVFKNPSTPRIKISRLYLRKSWQVYKTLSIFEKNETHRPAYYFGLLLKRYFTKMPRNVRDYKAVKMSNWSELICIQFWKTSQGQGYPESG